MAWELPYPWDYACIAGVFAVLTPLVFRMYLGAYHRRYFFNKALRLSAVRTLAWLILYGGSFVLVFWLISLVMPAGWLRYLVGGGIWWLLSNTVLALIWSFAGRVIDMEIG